MAHVLQTGNIFRPTHPETEVHLTLPVDVYTVLEDSQGLYFKRREAFRSLPPVYGKHPGWASRILATFTRKDSNMGVLLSGEKGGGKSLLGRLVAKDATKLGMPTLVVDRPHSPRALSELIASLSTPAVIFLDEFEKLYSPHSGGQQEFLTLLDGTSGSRHLFLFTVNDTRLLDEHMLNRPGRIHYHIPFSGLDSATIEAYCEEHLQASEELPTIQALAELFTAFNFDMLQTLVSEMNAFGEPAVEAVKLLNITPTDGRDEYTLFITLEDEEGERTTTKGWWHGDPLFDATHVFEVWSMKDKRMAGERVTVRREDATLFRPLKRQYSFTKGNATFTLIGEPKREDAHTWWHALKAPAGASHSPQADICPGCGRERKAPGVICRPTPHEWPVDEHGEVYWCALQKFYFTASGELFLPALQRDVAATKDASF